MVTQNSVDLNLPSSTTDNSIIRYDGAVGRSIQDSLVTISDTGVVDGCTELNVDNLSLNGNTLSSTNANGAINLTPNGVGDILGNSDNFLLSEAAVGSFVRIKTQNTDTTAASGASSYFVSEIDPAVTGQTYYRTAITGTRSYALGIDGSDNDQFKIAGTVGSLATLFSTLYMQITSDGALTIPLQPAFLAALGTDDLNVTGNGTAYVLGTNTALTEIFDQNADFNTNGTFTAPVTGKYTFHFALRMTTASMTGATNVLGEIVTSNRTYRIINVTASGNEPLTQIRGSTIADLDATDTAQLRVTVTGIGADTADISGGTTYTFFGGNLTC